MLARTTHPRTASTVGTPGYPSSWTYRNPCHVKRGSYSSADPPPPLPPRSTYTSSLRALPRFPRFTVPSSLSASAYLMVTAVPAVPRTESRAYPAMFWPRSNTNTPALGESTVNGTNRSTTCSAGAACHLISVGPSGAQLSDPSVPRPASACSTAGASQSPVAAPGDDHPSTSSRASYVSPS